MLTTLSSKGQVTVPGAIRAALGLDTGSLLDFSLLPDGSMRVRAVERDPLAIGSVLPKPASSRKKIAAISRANAGRAMPDPPGVKALVQQAALRRFVRSQTKPAQPPKAK